MWFDMAHFAGEESLTFDGLVNFLLKFKSPLVFCIVRSQGRVTLFLSN